MYKVQGGSSRSSFFQPRPAGLSFFEDSRFRFGLGQPQVGHSFTAVVLDGVAQCSHSYPSLLMAALPVSASRKLPGLKLKGESEC